MIGIFNGRQLFDSDKTVFAQINVALREHLHEFNTGKNTNPFAVFMAIALHASEDGWAWPSRDLLKQETGIKSEAAITSALRHLRKMRIKGQRVFAHYRVHEKSGVWGRSAYLIFPDAEHGTAPFEGMVEYTTQPPIDKPLVDEPPIENLSLQEEPSFEAEPSKAEERGAPSAPSPTKRKRTSPPTKPKQGPEPPKWGKNDCKHPAIQAHREQARRWVPIALRLDVIEAVGEVGESVERWSDTVKAYIGQGWNPSNVNGMLDFFNTQRMPGARNGRTKQSTHDPIAQAQKMLAEMEVD